GAVDSDTRLVLTNAVYFKGDWNEPFRKEVTRDAPFKVSSRQQVQTPLMFQQDHFGYGETPELQVLSLPYGQSKRLSMVVLLPREVDGLPALEKKLTAQSLNEWLGKLGWRE